MHPNAGKPRVAIIVLATLICVSLVGLVRPALAELLPLRTEDVCAALVGSGESSDPIQIPALPVGHPAVSSDEAYSALIAYAEEVRPTGATRTGTDEEGGSALRRYAAEVAAGQQPIP